MGFRYPTLFFYLCTISSMHPPPIQRPSSLASQPSLSLTTRSETSVNHSVSQLPALGHMENPQTAQQCSWFLPSTLGAATQGPPHRETLPITVTLTLPAGIISPYLPPSVSHQSLLPAHLPPSSLGPDGLSAESLPTSPAPSPCLRGLACFIT